MQNVELDDIVFGMLGHRRALASVKRLPADRIPGRWTRMEEEGNTFVFFFLPERHRPITIYIVIVRFPWLVLFLPGHHILFEILFPFY
jgi:hypothetical protein